MNGDHTDPTIVAAVLSLLALVFAWSYALYARKELRQACERYRKALEWYKRADTRLADADSLLSRAQATLRVATERYNAAALAAQPEREEMNHDD